MIVEKIHIFAAEQGSAEDVLGPIISEEKLAEISAKVELMKANPVFQKLMENEEMRTQLEAGNLQLDEAEARSVMDLARDLGALRPQSEQSQESAQLDALIASSGSNRIAEIAAVDRIVDPVVERGPIDVRIGGSHIKNPG